MNKIINSRFKPLLKVIYANVSSARINFEAASLKNINFIWIPKTAGTSIFKFLNENFAMQKRKRSKHFLSFPNKGAVTFVHVSYTQLLALGVVSKDYHEKAYKFSIVRNPYDRAVSLYNYLIQDKEGRVSADKTFKQFLEDVYLFRQPIGLYNSIGISQANPQADWVIGLDGKLLVDNFFKLENLDVFAKKMKTKYNVNFDSDIKLNVSAKKLSLQEAYQDSTCVELVQSIYERDFDLFGYCKNTIPHQKN